MRARLTLVACAAIVSLSAPAYSQDYAREGLYVGAGILGGSYTDVEDEVEDFVPVSVDVDPAVGFELYGGYRLHPNFALEAEFEMLPEAEVDASGFGELAEIQTLTFTGNAKFFPLTGRAQPFVLIGLGLISAEIEDSVGAGIDEDETGFAARFGGGLDFYVTDNFVLSGGVDYVLPAGDDFVDELNYVSYGGGAMFRF